MLWSPSYDLPNRVHFLGSGTVISLENAVSFVPPGLLNRVIQ